MVLLLLPLNCLFDTSIIIITYNNIKYNNINLTTGKKGKGFPYSLLSVGSGVDPGVQAVSQQVTISHLPGGRLPLLSAKPAVTFPTAKHHRS